MTAPTTPTLDEQIATDVAVLAQLTDEIKQRTDQAAEIKTRLRGLGAGDWWHNGRAVLNVGTPGQQFDPALAAAVIPAAVIPAAVIPAALVPACSDTKLSGPKAKAILPPALYTQCCTEKAAAVKTL